MMSCMDHVCMRSVHVRANLLTNCASFENGSPPKVTLRRLPGRSRFQVGCSVFVSPRLMPKMVLLPRHCTKRTDKIKQESLEHCKSSQLLSTAHDASLTHLLLFGENIKPCAILLLYFRAMPVRHTMSCSSSYHCPAVSSNAILHELAHISSRCLLCLTWARSSPASAFRRRASPLCASQRQWKEGFANSFLFQILKIIRF
jgi:hypothetical protein